MNHSQPTGYRCHLIAPGIARRLTLAAILSIAAISWPAKADTLSIRRPTEPASVAPTVYTDVKVSDIVEGRISFTTTAGNTVNKDLASVVAMSIDDEPAFNQAQLDYAAKNFN
ncbi:MAG TPA: hypothetical protein VGG44_03910, partial [Tepidisphaeraceae bacterium]